MKVRYFLILLVVFAFFLRIYRINELPLYGDELTLAYDSYSILKTGRDQTGDILPLTFKMGAARPGGYIYASLPFIALFGPTALGIRLLSLFSGLLLIVIVWLLANKLFGKQVAMIAAVLTAISPWNLYLSRVGFEAHFALMLATLGLTAFMYAEKKSKLYIVWALSWGVALLTYPTFKLTLPILGLLLIWWHGRGVFKNQFFRTSLAILFLFSTLVVRETFLGNSESRFLSQNIFTNPIVSEAVVQKVNYERSVSTAPIFVTNILHNKYTEYGKIVISEYAKNLSPEFLFFVGDRNPRHNPAEWGMLYVADFVLIVFGLYALVSKRKQVIFIVAWILIVPLATMFLADTHSLRNAFMLPALILISAYGMSNMSKNLKIILAFVIAIQLIIILDRVYFVAPNKFASFWSKTAQLASEKAIKEKSNYKFIYISESIDNIEYAYPAYAKIHPSEVQSQYGMYPKKYDNVIITNTNDPMLVDTDRSLIIKEKPVDSVNLTPAIQTFSTSND